MKRKQRIALAFVALYVFSVMGLALSLHFCGGKLANVHFLTSEISCKLCKDIPEDKLDDGCCQNTSVSVKVEDSHQVASKVDVPKSFSFEISIIQPVYEFINVTISKAITFFVNKAPPKSALFSLCIINCIFRI